MASTSQGTNPRNTGPTSGEDDAVLIGRFIDGDEPAFDMLLLRHQNKAFSLALALTGNHEDAAEVTQDAFVKVYHALGEFRQDASFSTWLYRIVSNTAHNRTRHLLSRGKGRTFSLDDGAAHQHAAGGEGPDERAAVKEEVQSFLTCMEELTPAHREVLALYSIQQLSYEEIAGLLDISTGTVKSRLSRARDELLKLYKQRA